MNGAQALVESLKREQVDHIFGYAGATICPLADALKDVPEIGYTLVRTEQNAGHMASGYARTSGKVGVCMVTSGPGATNLITGIATAYMDSIPMVAITGQVPSHLLGRDIFQEVAITGAVAPMFEFPADTTRAVLNLMAHRTLTRYPGIRLVVPHCGSFLPYMLQRFIGISRALEGTGVMEPVDARAEFDRLWFDLAGDPEPAALKSLLLVADPGRIVYGSDYPYTPGPAAGGSCVSSFCCSCF